jgi:hypothetical protein
VSDLPTVALSAGVAQRALVALAVGKAGKRRDQIDALRCLIASQMLAAAGGEFVREPVRSVGALQ